MVPHRCMPACSRLPRRVQYTLIALHRCICRRCCCGERETRRMYVNNDSDLQEWTTQNRTRIMNFTAEYRRFYLEETARIIGELSAPLFQYLELIKSQYRFYCLIRAIQTREW